MRIGQLTFGFLSSLSGRLAPRPQKPQPLLAEARGLLSDLGLHGLARRVRVQWNPRMRSTAGRATWPDAVVELNPALRQIGDGEVRRTLRHELAHLVAYERSGRRRIRPHGREWRQACADLGIPGESASHHLELPTRKMRRKWLYTCPGCGETVARVRRMARYSSCWACCRRFSGGQYDERFRFVESRLGDS